MKPSKYQEDIYKHLVATNKNLLIGATAGSGKTTTIVECAKLIPLNKLAIFIAFNKHIAYELKNRLPKNVPGETLHAIGYACLRKHYFEVSFYDKKQIGFIEPFFMHVEDQRKKWKSIYNVDNVMKLARATMTKPSKEELTLLLERHALEIDEEEMTVLMRAMRKFRDYNDDLERYKMSIDFQDMIAIPALYDIVVPKYDYVFIDECQDMSVLDRMFIDKMVKPITGRKISVGDPRQAIYSFRGSDLNSFEVISKQPNTIKLPLTVCYRCARAIVERAAEVYPEIEAWDGAEAGVVATGAIESIQEGDFVLCRNTYPLVEALLLLIDKGLNAYIVGKDMTTGLLKLMAGLDAYAECLESWPQIQVKEKERVTRELAIKGVVSNPERHPKFTALEEKLSILFVLFRKFKYIYEVEQFILEIFEDEDEDRDGVKMMTIHKSKGLEADRVFVIETFEEKALIPSQHAVTEEQMIVETNLRFVAYTRARKELYYLYL